MRLKYGVGLYCSAENVIFFLSTKSRIYSFMIAEKGIPIFLAVFCAASFSFLSVLNITVVCVAIYWSIYPGIRAVKDAVHFLCLRIWRGGVALIVSIFFLGSNLIAMNLNVIKPQKHSVPAESGQYILDCIPSRLETLAEEITLEGRAERFNIEQSGVE